jgi:hypothetical protein
LTLHSNHLLYTLLIGFQKHHHHYRHHQQQHRPSHPMPLFHLLLYSPLLHLFTLTLMVASVSLPCHSMSSRPLTIMHRCFPSCVCVHPRVSGGSSSLVIEGSLRHSHDDVISALAGKSLATIPLACALAPMLRSSFRQHSTGKRIVMIGDSNMRFQYLNLAYFLCSASWCISLF